MCKVEAIISYFYEVMTNVIFKKIGKCQGQNVEYQHNVLITRDIHVKYQSSSTHYSKLLARLKFLKSRSNSQVKITRSKILEPMERYYHMGYSCEISKL